MKYLLLLPFVLITLVGFGKQDTTLYFSLEPLNELVVGKTTVNEALKMFGDSGLVLKKRIHHGPNYISTSINLKYEHLGLLLSFSSKIAVQDWQLYFKPKDKCILSRFDLDSTSPVVLNRKIKFKKSNWADIKAVLGTPKAEPYTLGAYLKSGQFRLVMSVGNDSLLNSIGGIGNPYSLPKIISEEVPISKSSAAAYIEYMYGIEKLRVGMTIFKTRRKVKGYFVKVKRQKGRGARVSGVNWTSSLHATMDIPRKGLLIRFGKRIPNGRRGLTRRHSWKYKYKLGYIDVNRLEVGGREINVGTTSPDEIEHLLGPAHTIFEQSDGTTALQYIDNGSTRLITFYYDADKQVFRIGISFK